MAIINTNDTLVRVLLWLCVILLVGLIATTVAGGFYSAGLHPGDESLEVIYASVVYTSPYLIYGVLGLALYQLKKTRTIAYTYAVGVVLLSATWVINNLVRIKQDVTFKESMYVTLNENFIMSAIIAGIFALILISESYLTLPKENDYQ